MEKMEDDSRVVGRMGRADTLPNFIPEKAQSSMGLEGRPLLLVDFLEAVIQWPFTSSPGSKGDEEGLPRPFFSGTRILDGHRASLPLPRGTWGTCSARWPRREDNGPWS